MSDEELKQLEEKMEGMIIRAVQSGKQETSNLAGDLLAKMKQEINSEIKVTVNGKIDKIKAHLEMQDHKLDDIKQEQKTVREKLEKVEPIIVGRATIVNAGKFLLWSSGILIAVSSIIYIFIKFFKYIQGL